MAHNKLYIYKRVPLEIDLWIDIEHNLNPNSIIKLFVTLPDQN